jgi:predicted DNA-binding protein
MLQQINSNPRVQLPVRISPELFNELDSMSTETHIPKSVLTRIAIKRLITDLNESGAPTILKMVCEV